MRDLPDTTCVDSTDNSLEIHEGLHDRSQEERHPREGIFQGVLPDFSGFVVERSGRWKRLRDWVLRHLTSPSAVEAGAHSVGDQPEPGGGNAPDSGFTDHGAGAGCTCVERGPGRQQVIARPDAAEEAASGTKPPEVR